MIGVLLIATRKYKVFVEPLLEQIDKFFLPKEELTIFLFTDEEFDYDKHDYDFVIKQFRIKPYVWPYATLYRFKIFNEHSEEMKDCSHLFYMDVDVKIDAPVWEEILGEGLTVVRHCGFYASGGWGSPSVPVESKAFVPVEDRGRYYAGGFNGGKTEVFLEMSKVLAANIADDEKRGIIVEHNDESHVNHFIVYNKQIPLIELHSGYCIVESEYLRQNWGVGDLPVFLIALDKNHAEIRS